MSERVTARHEALMPVLRWLHSEKHDEPNAQGEWHRAWEAMAQTLYWDPETRLRDLEHDVHENIGIPVENCQCEVCHG